MTWRTDRSAHSRASRIAPLLVGKGRFIDDIAAARRAARGASCAARIRMPRSAAIDADAALALPGVHAVLTLDDLAPVMAQRRMLRHSNSGHAARPVLVVRARRRRGRPMSARPVAHRASPTTATSPRMPPRWSTVDYDVLPAVADCRKAARRARRRSAASSTRNIIATYKVAYGDAEAAFAQGRARLPRGALAASRRRPSDRGPRHSSPNTRGDDGGMTVWASTQKAHDLFQSLTALLDFDESRLRVATPDVGGGFGPKLCVYPEDVAVVAAAKLLRRSIKWIEDRREHFTNAAQERDQYWSLDIAVDADAQAARRARPAHPRSRRLCAAGREHPVQLGLDDERALYAAGAVDGGHGRRHQQDAGVVGARRRLSAGGLRDGAADGPRRARAAARPRRGARGAISSRPRRCPTRSRSRRAPAPACNTTAATIRPARRRCWRPPAGTTFRSRQATARAQGRYIGIGLAHGIKGTGRGPFESGLVRVSNTGRVSVFTGAAAIGQGLGTALAQICAGELGLRAQDITRGPRRHRRRVARPRRLRQPPDRDRRLVRAARRARRRGRRRRSSPAMCWRRPSTISRSPTARCAWSARRSSRSSSASSRASCSGAPGYGFPPDVEPGLEANVNWRTDALAYANACHVAEVEVDIETGGGADRATMSRCRTPAC